MTDSEISLHGHADCEVDRASLGDQPNLFTKLGYTTKSLSPECIFALNRVFVWEIAVKIPSQEPIWEYELAIS